MRPTSVGETHSVTTMLRVYTAWAEGAIEADIEATKRAMTRRPGKLLDALKSEGTGEQWREITQPAQLSPDGEAPQGRSLEYWTTADTYNALL